MEKQIIQTRIESAVKQEAEIILNKFGLTLNEAVKILCFTVANEKMIPFNLTGNTPKDIEEENYRLSQLPYQPELYPHLIKKLTPEELAERRREI